MGVWTLNSTIIIPIFIQSLLVFVEIVFQFDSDLHRQVDVAVDQNPYFIVPFPRGTADQKEHDRLIWLDFRLALYSVDNNLTRYGNHSSDERDCERG